MSLTKAHTLFQTLTLKLLFKMALTGAMSIVGLSRGKIYGPRNTSLTLWLLKYNEKYLTNSNSHNDSTCFHLVINTSYPGVLNLILLTLSAPNATNKENLIKRKKLPPSVAHSVSTQCNYISAYLHDYVVCHHYDKWLCYVVLGIIYCSVTSHIFSRQKEPW